MKASDRCKAVSSGDRCRKERGHDSPLAMVLDPWHEGVNQRWDGKQAVQKHDMSRAKDLKKVAHVLKRFVESSEIDRVRFMQAGPGENGFRTMINFVRKGEKK